MIINGLKTRESNTLVYRMADPSIDLDGHGKPVSSNYIVIVNRKDCGSVFKNDVEYVDPDNVKQAVVLKYGGTYYGYGEKKLIKQQTPRYIKTKFEGKKVTEWYESRFYAVMRGKVYTTTIRSFVSLSIQRESRIEQIFQ